ncbi:hypothetical protein Y032_0029g2004 [Ancylostoma ceylanicum]|uniref:Uncharacterized protein n=1 Tax=Ancylostoma ceylanicum TaxID=53326 RepID=A0A016USV1_9BILA|nr:hypothetical protein Y032_0029g2004 [Ancylostoma ceylanicum]
MVRVRRQPKWGDRSTAMIRVRLRPKWGSVSRRIPQCDNCMPPFRGVESPRKMEKCTETGPILRDGYACIQCGFLSYMLPVFPYTDLPTVFFSTLCPFHSCLNEPPSSFCLHTPVLRIGGALYLLGVRVLPHHSIIHRFSTIIGLLALQASTHTGTLPLEHYAVLRRLTAG